MGAIGYPRTEAGEGDEDAVRGDFVAFNSAFTELKLGRDTRRVSAIAVATLERLSRDRALPDDLLVAISIELRDLCYRAWVREGGEGLHWRAMEVCSVHWRKLHTPLDTSLGPEIHAALEAYGTAITPAQKGAASERLGLASCLYYMSAFAGQDLGKLEEKARPIEDSRYRELRSPEGRILYFKGGGAYNINLLAQLDIPDADRSLIMVGEAKGGESRLGTVRGPKLIMEERDYLPISQDDFMYPVTRAMYMRKDVQANAIGQSR